MREEQGKGVGMRDPCCVCVTGVCAREISLTNTTEVRVNASGYFGIFS